MQGQFHSVPRPVVNKEMPFELIAVPEGAAFISCNLSVFFNQFYFLLPGSLYFSSFFCIFASVYCDSF